MAARGREKQRRELDWGLLPGLLGYALRRAQTAVFADFARAVPELTPGQFGILALIDANPGLSQSELGAALGVDRSTVVATLDRLEARRLLARTPSPSDRRAHALALTLAGAALFADASRRIRAHELRIAAGLDRHERRALIALLERVAR